MIETNQMGHVRPPAAARRRVPAFFTALFTRRTWAELLYALVALPQGVFGFVFVVVTVSLSLGLMVTFVGLPLLAGSGLVARWIGWQWREGTNLFLGWNTPAPGRFRRGRGLFGWIGACLKDGTAWRARVYLALKLPLGIASFVTATVFYAYGLWSLSYGIWHRWLPCNTDDAGVCHHATQLWNGYYVDTAPSILWMAAVGLVLLLLAPWVVRGVLAVDRLAVRALLGPSWTAARVAELEETRAQAVDDSAATLRRIERDLHDGTQARLVALAMNVGLAKEKLAEGADPAEAAALLERAHTTAKDAIAEVRDLARGIHPAVLDAGLDTALATLAAHSPVPVRLTTTLTARGAPAIETIAYFCAAELVTNVAKHSGATYATLDVRTVGDRLRLRVSDDGGGGARIGAGSGLSGLGERVRTVDGRLTVDSPDGGPTVVTVELPLQAGGA
ncbi:MAG: sensor histidine kinase [Mycobacteriales bacterium]